MRHLLLALLFGFFCNAHAAVNDPLPLDSVARPDGTILTGWYLLNRHYDGPYADGKKTLDGSVSMQVAALRIGKFMDINGTTFAFGAFLPWSSSELTFNTAGLPPRLGARIASQESEAHGLGDLRLGATVWLINAPDRREFLTVNSTVILPTGSYDEKRTLNIGDNRWTLLFSAGWNKPLGEKLVLELVPEIAFYGDNPDYLDTHRLEKNTTYALSSTLRYRITPDFHTFIGLQINRGGETRLDGLDRDDATGNNRASLGALYITPNKSMWTVRYSHDTRIRNGYRLEDELGLRLQVPF